MGKTAHSSSTPSDAQAVESALRKVADDLRREVETLQGHFRLGLG